MKRSMIQWRALAIGFLWVLPAASYAAPGTLSTQPLWLKDAVRHNVMLAIDDSGSMDLEIMVSAEDGIMYVSSEGHFDDGAGKLYNQGGESYASRYGYLFPNGYNSTYDGRRLLRDDDNVKAIPPINAYGFTRSPDYNKSYYDPDVTYDPWPSYGGYIFSNASASATRFEPIDAKGTGTLNLFTDLDASAKADQEYWAFYIGDSDMVCDDSGNACSEGRKHYTYYPATYYLKQTSGTYTYKSPITLITETRSCAADEIDPAHYRDFVKNPSAYSGVDAIATDGACLTKYKITGTDADTFTNGSAVTRTVAEEKQNFANWFMYHRKRHLATRGAMAHAFYGVSGLNVGLFWINNRIEATMRNIGDSTQLTALLKAHYEHVGSGGTPLRTALKHAGDQFLRTNTGAPVTEECQRNFTLLFTDGYNNSTVSGINNEDDGKGEPYEDEESGTLADVAMKYYSTVLRTGIGFPAGEVPIPDACSVTPLDPSLDCSDDLHMNTYTVGLGGKGSIFGATHDSVADAYDASPTWPDVDTMGSIYQIDDLYHAAVNGRGEAFQADTPDQLQTALSNAVDQIISTIGTGSGVTFNTASLKADSNIFSTVFNSQGWHGDLQARSLDEETGEVESDIKWSAADELNDRNMSVSPRTILTLSGTDGVAFTWSTLSSSMQDDLKMSPSGVAEVSPFTLAQKRVQYLRGELDGADEGLRVRESLLGDLINSKPLFVGQPSSVWPAANPFGATDNRHGSEFKNLNLADGGAKDRTPIVYVGGNDGMLHGFNADANSADAGKEVLAYVPSFLASTASGQGLHYLTDPDYKHRYYVDLDPVMQDVYIKTSTSGTQDWRTILVGGAGAGGKGIFALDITNPASFSQTSTAPANTVLWEFDSADDADMGYITEPPLIAMMENEKWAVIFGNGYESTNGVAKLMILFIEEGLDGSWTTAGDYIEVSTAVGTAADKNGLSAVAGVDVDKDSKVDRIYAGDVKGNMWAFDVSGSSTSSWTVAYKQGTTPKPLFIAQDSTTAIQPITKAPNVVRHVDEESGGDPNMLVMFGTGQYLVDNDVSSSQEQTIYTVWDHGTKELTRSNLVVRTLTQTAGVISSAGSAITWNNKDGWYADLDSFGSGGERITQRPVFRLDKELGVAAFFSTNVPSSDACAQGGKSALYCLPVATGVNAGRGLCDLNQDGAINASDQKAGTVLDMLVSEVSLLGDKIYFNETINDSGELGTNTDTIDSDIKSDSNAARTGRLGWHELMCEE